MTYTQTSGGSGEGKSGMYEGGVLLVAHCWHVGDALGFFSSSSDGFYLKKKGDGNAALWIEFPSSGHYYR